MRMTFSVAALLSLAVVSPIPVFAADAAMVPALQLAMTLEQMNCASSDVQAREEDLPTSADSVTSGEALKKALRADNSSGTNGIPCPPRDPKTPPRQRS